MTTGFTFGGLGAQPSTTTAAPAGFSFGAAAPTQATTAASGFGQSTPAASGGFSLGGVKAPSTTIAAPGFALGGTAAAPTTSTGLGFGLSQTTAKPAAQSLGFPLGGATSSNASTGFPLGGATSSAPSTGFSFGSTTTTASTGGLLGTTAASSAASFGLGKTIAGNPLAAPSSTKTTGLGGVPATTTTGLGGVDPSTITTTTGGTIGSTKLGLSDGKAVKEEKVPALIMESVENFKKFVKEEKAVRENISRMTTKPIQKVQEDFIGLKQLLSELSNCLQRNSCTVGKLKAEMTETLKAAEMAQATHETPPGLQYGNTEPTVYFQKLVEKFENNMQTYRQQIETLESHLVATQQSNRLTPNDLVNVMKKLHEAFVVLAAQVYEVNQAVKTQKEHFLNYQRVFHGETKDLFEVNRRLQTNIVPKESKGGVGPNSFTGMSNATAVVMASALNRSQQPQVPQPSVMGLGTNTLGGGAIGGFGSTGVGTTNTATGFGAANTSAGLFGAGTGQATTTAGGGYGFGLNTTAQANTLGFGAGLQNATQQYGVQPVNQQFQLGKPPIGGSKKGKR